MQLNEKIFIISELVELQFVVQASALFLIFVFSLRSSKKQKIPHFFYNFFCTGCW